MCSNFELPLKPHTHTHTHINAITVLQQEVWAKVIDDPVCLIRLYAHTEAQQQQLSDLYNPLKFPIHHHILLLILKQQQRS